jgi:prepilin-type N-terminal cleavage/methylation domain-containing protein/prepilin-type processing-associated H-X9-DG protein
MNIKLERRQVSVRALTERNEHRAGFTLVELLVVIAIIGILIGLLLPAVQAALESGRRSACHNNLHQIGLATTAYETSQRQYPVNWGVVGSAGTPTTGVGATSTGVSWLTLILPYMDDKPLYDQIAIGAPMNFAGNYNGIPCNNLVASQNMVKTFICPSDPQVSTFTSSTFGNGAYGPTNYKACAGMNWSQSITGPPYAVGPGVMWTKGRNANNKDGVDHGNGIICRGGGTLSGSIPTNGAPPTLIAAATQAPLVTQNVDIRDGASKTFLAGETVPAWCPWSLWMWFDGSTASCGMPMNYFRFLSPPDPTANAGNWNYSYSFMSKHKGGCNFAAVDGSVHFVAETIDMTVYQALATIDGGEASVASTNNPGTTVTVDFPQ